MTIHICVTHLKFPITMTPEQLFTTIVNKGNPTSKEHWTSAPSKIWIYSLSVAIHFLELNGTFLGRKIKAIPNLHVSTRTCLAWRCRRPFLGHCQVQSKLIKGRIQYLIQHLAQSINIPHKCRNYTYYLEITEYGLNAR